MLIAHTHVLIEMTDECDCRLIGSWLIKAAEAQTFWLQARRDPDFENRVFGLCAFCVPNLECAALELLGALEHRHRVLAADLHEIETGVFSIEFGMMVQLGFFLPASQRYQMTLPESVTLEGCSRRL
ncbi:hypothetical protein ACFIOY_38955 [Bradyrhizobium sp. TZ2]